MNESKVFYLSDGKELIAGFETTTFTQDDINIIEQDKLDKLNESYVNEEYEDLLKDNYKVLIFDIETFSPIESPPILYSQYNSQAYFQLYII